MYKIETPTIIKQFIGIFYRLGIWKNGAEVTYLKHFYFIYFTSVVISIIMGLYFSEVLEEITFSVLATVIECVHCYRFWIVLFRQKECLLMIDQISTHNTNDRDDVIEVNKNLNPFTTFLHNYAIVIGVCCFFVAIVYPLANEKQLFINIAFPFDRDNSEAANWVANFYVITFILLAATCTLFTSVTWYLMLSISFKYQILGNQLRRLGRTHLNVSLAEQQKFFFRELIDALQTYDKINGTLKEFISHFDKLFFLQIATGSVTICCALYPLAFGSHENMSRDGVYCCYIMYGSFDIFMIMYLGNRITLRSNELSNCLYESSFIEQTKSTKMCILILMERFRRPQRLVVGLIYPLNLQTFTSISNGAYTIFNILRGLK